MARQEYIPYDDQVKKLTVNRLSWSQFDAISSLSGISPEELWFIQDSELSGQPIVVDTTPRPTKLSQFENDVPYLSAVSWSQVTGKPTIPTKTSQLTNDSGFVTSAYVHYHNTKWRDWRQEDYDPRLNFTAQQANSTLQMQKNNISAPNVSLEYSTDGETWQDFIVGGTIVTLANVGDKMWLRAKTTNSGFATSWSDYNTFVMTGKIAASGSIMCLLKNDGNTNTVPSNYCFSFLFSNCTSLTQAPELPATTLTPACYGMMFSGCTSLTTAPELPATTMFNNCYYRMFSGCTSLNEIKIGYTGNFSGPAFSIWVYNVASTGTFYYNGSDTTRGSSAIPSNWNVQTF